MFIGRRGEHHFRKIKFDVSSLLGDEYPGTALNAIYKRPDGIAYPVVTSYIDTIVRTKNIVNILTIACKKLYASNPKDM